MTLFVLTLVIRSPVAVVPVGVGSMSRTTRLLSVVMAMTELTLMSTWELLSAAWDSLWIMERLAQVKERAKVAKRIIMYWMY